VNRGKELECRRDETGKRVGSEGYDDKKAN